MSKFLGRIMIRFFILRVLAYELWHDKNSKASSEQCGTPRYTLRRCRKIDWEFKGSNGSENSLTPSKMFLTKLLQLEVGGQDE